MNPDDLAELEEQRAFLVRSLDDLDRELAAGDIDELDAATLRDDYTHRLAEVQRAIEGGRAAIVEAAPPRRWGRITAIVAVVALVGVGSGVAVAQLSGSREPGQTSTGGIREGTNDLLNRAASLQVEGDFLGALKLYDQVIADDPENDEALAERGFVLLRFASASGRTDYLDDGLRFIDQALELDPGNPRWLVYRSMGLRFLGRTEEADAAVDEALANDPPEDLRRQIEAIRAQADAPTGDE